MCDGIVNCSDGKDEARCSNVDGCEFRCSNGDCVHGFSVCGNSTYLRSHYYLISDILPIYIDIQQMASSIAWMFPMN